MTSVLFRILSNYLFLINTQLCPKLRCFRQRFKHPAKKNRDATDCPPAAIPVWEVARSSGGSGRGRCRCKRPVPPTHKEHHCRPKAHAAAHPWGGAVETFR